MKFDKGVFKHHYGRTYIKRIWLAAVLAVFGELVSDFCVLYSIYLPWGMDLILNMMVFVGVLWLPMSICGYYRALKMCRRQKQYMRNGRLHVLMVPEDGFTLNGFITYTMLTEFNRIDRIDVTKEFLVVHGDMHLTENCNGEVTEGDYDTCKIPRCFTHEEQIIGMVR